MRYVSCALSTCRTWGGARRAGTAPSPLVLWGHGSTGEVCRAKACHRLGARSPCRAAPASNLHLLANGPALAGTPMPRRHCCDEMQAAENRALTPGVARSSWWIASGWLTTTTYSQSTLKQSKGPTSAAHRSRARWCLQVHVGAEGAAGLSVPGRAAPRATAGTLRCRPRQPATAQTTRKAARRRRKGCWQSAHLNATG